MKNNGKYLKRYRRREKHKAWMDKDVFRPVLCTCIPMVSMFVCAMTYGMLATLALAFAWVVFVILFYKGIL